MSPVWQALRHVAFRYLVAGRTVSALGLSSRDARSLRHELPPAAPVPVKESVA